MCFQPKQLISLQSLHSINFLFVKSIQVNLSLCLLGRKTIMEEWNQQNNSIYWLLLMSERRTQPKREKFIIFSARLGAANERAGRAQRGASQSTTNFSSSWREKWSCWWRCLPPQAQQINTFLHFFAKLKKLREKLVDLPCCCGNSSPFVFLSFSINQINFTLWIDDWWKKKKTMEPRALRENVFISKIFNLLHSIHSLGQPMAAAFINSIILLILKEKNEMNWMSCWWPAAKKSNSSIPSTIDSNFHKFPSIIEVLSLFDSFNYCYNNLLILFHQFHSTLHEINETKWKDKFICLWICGMISWSGMELWLASSIKTKVFNYGVKGYIFWAQSTPIPLQWNIPFVLSLTFINQTYLLSLIKWRMKTREMKWDLMELNWMEFARVSSSAGADNPQQRQFNLSFHLFPFIHQFIDWMEERKGRKEEN